MHRGEMHVAWSTVMHRGEMHVAWSRCVHGVR